MNKLLKIIVSILGGVNTAFSIIIPIFVSLLIIQTVDLSNVNQWIIVTIGILASIYRGLRTWL